MRPYRQNTTVEKHGYGFCKVTHRFLRGLHLVPYRMFDPREDNIQKQRGNPKMLGCKMAAKQSESKDTVVILMQETLNVLYASAFLSVFHCSLIMKFATFTHQS